MMCFNKNGTPKFSILKVCTHLDNNCGNDNNDRYTLVVEYKKMMHGVYIYDISSTIWQNVKYAYTWISW